MRSYRMLGLGCVLVLAGCANNADLATTGAPVVTPQPDSGAANNSGGSQGGGMTSGASSGGATDDEDGGTTSGTSGGASGSSTSSGASSGGTSAGSTAGKVDAGITPPAPSGVIISEVMARPSSGSDNEWIEIFNAGDKSLDLQGCALATGEDAADETIIDATLLIAPGAYVLFGRDGVEAQSGVKPDYVYTGLYLSPDEIVTLSCNGQIVTQVSYVGAVLAASLQLDARYVASGMTDLQAAWCNGSDALPLSSNLGTPKSANRDCSGVPAP